MKIILFMLVVCSLIFTYINAYVSFSSTRSVSIRNLFSSLNSNANKSEQSIRDKTASSITNKLTAALFPILSLTTASLLTSPVIARAAAPVTEDDYIGIIYICLYIIMRVCILLCMLHYSVAYLLFTILYILHIPY